MSLQTCFLGNFKTRILVMKAKALTRLFLDQGPDALERNLSLQISGQLVEGGYHSPSG